MRNENLISLSKYRIEVAQERLKSAGIMVKYDDYKAAANRSYYAVFSAMRAVLALDGLDFKKHSGVIAEFRKSYIKTGVFSTELSRIIDSLKDVRQSSDYDDFYLISKEEIAEQVEDAEFFVNAVSGYLAERYKTE